MATFPVLQESEGEWTSSKLVEILRLRIPSSFVPDPQLLHDFITGFQTRPDDVFVVSYPKSGTSWIQEIAWQIYHNGETSSAKMQDGVPFVEDAANPNSTQPDIKTLPSPRLLKTHLSYEAIPKATNKDANCKYIYIARNPKDAAVSSYKFIKSFGSGTGLSAPWEYYVKLFIEGKTMWNHWNDHVLGWWEHKNAFNVLFLKYEDLQKDLLSNVRIIADFLNKPLPDDLAKRIAEQCTFKGMMENVQSYLFEDKEDGPSLLQKGVVGNWKEHFTPELNERFEKEVLAKLKGSGLEFDFEL
ncbi:sulfotransferase 1C2-like [Stylophora pistillata]|uniref:sulfotransferase 1C2-like n=1 Tax=Stylophora pistillata TaxID=50429 RepID=UPI000C04BA9D|nr:sulfotransferase 1C2-like [Stylophora pistillata]